MSAPLGFDRVARVYRWLEYATSGSALERIRFVHLPRLKSARRVLILGEGDGRFLERLLAVNFEAIVTVVEQSPKMIELARERTGSVDRVRFLQLDVRDYLSQLEQTSATFDAIVALFFLDCFDADGVEALVQSLSARLTAGGAWFVSDYHVPERGLQRVLAYCWVFILYRFFGVFTNLRARELVLPDVYLNHASCELELHSFGAAGKLRAAEFRKRGSIIE